MSNEDYYVKFITKVFSGSLSATATQINDDVKSITNLVFLEIQKCTGTMLAGDAIYALFYNVTSFADLLVNIVSGIALGTISGWIDVIRQNIKYRVCVDAAAVKWKSVMALALLGMSRASKEEIIGFLKINADFDATNDEEIRNVFHLLRQISAKTKEAQDK